MNSYESRNDWVWLGILTVFAVVALSGCAVMEELTEPRPTKVTKPAEPIPPKRELGSLWSEGSMWNHVYTAAASRVVGDIVTIRLDEAFTGRVARLQPREDAPVDPEAKGAARAIASTENDSKRSELLLRGTIEEVGPRGIYRISASDTLKLGAFEPTVLVKGRVRDRDIDENDELRVADVVDLSLSVVQNNADRDGAETGVDNVSW